MQEVGGSIPPGSTRICFGRASCRYWAFFPSPSSRGLGHHPFTVRTGVRIPVGTPISNAADYWRAPAGGSCPDALASVWRKLPACGIAAKIPAMKFLDPDTESAVRDFLARIPGDIRLDRAILFGSRARGEHRPDSDADVALILHERGDDGETLMMLAELAYYAYLDTGIMVQPVPIAIEDWLNPAAFPRPGFLRNVAREGIVL